MHRWLKTWFVALSSLVGGCGLQLPDDYPASRYTRGTLLGEKNADGQLVTDPIALAPETEEKVAAALNDTYFPPPWTWDDATLKQAHLRVRAGQELYQKHCIHCHGVAGGGDGPTAPFLFPRPRDYRRGTFKWKSTGLTARPTRNDLLLFLKNGAPGTSMPSFALLPEQDLEDLVDYVVYLAKRGEVERKLIRDILDNDGAFPAPDAIAGFVSDVEQSWAAAEGEVIQPEHSMPVYSMDSPEFEASVKRGKAVYRSNVAQCVKCHGEDGKADPNKMAEAEKKQLFDDWGFTNYPRNLTLGLFRGGRRPVDIYRRVHQGIAGASMPAGGKNLKPEEIWDLVNFVRALPYRKNLLADAPVSASAAPQGASGHGN